MTRRRSAYAEHPDYRVDCDPSDVGYRVRLGDTVVAESDRALVVRETRHSPVVYVPREDVRFELLERSDHHSFCPFKGEASYWTLKAGEVLEENLAWSYEDPFEEVTVLRGYVSFYTNRTQVESCAPDPGR